MNTVVPTAEVERKTALGNTAKRIEALAKQIMPTNSKTILFGSRARGDAREDSDWDILVLLDKKSITPSDHDNYAYPFWELGWTINEMIHPIVYSLDDWNKKANPIFKYNVEKEGIVLC